MKRYPDLPALLAGVLGTRAPSPQHTQALAGKIREENPGASHVVLFKNGHWTLLPVGPGCKIKSPDLAAQATIPPNRRPVAYCKI